MNMNDVTNIIAETTRRLLAGEIDLKTASEVNNGMGKVIRGHAASVAYSAVHSSNAMAKIVPFFEETVINQKPALENDGAEK